MDTQASFVSTRDHLAIALDTGDLGAAVSLATAIQPHFGIAKVGLQLFSAAGIEAVRAVQGIGMAVFLDVKLHDIPNTVYGASKVLGSLGARYLTVHASGGLAMLQAATKGLGGARKEITTFFDNSLSALTCDDANTSAVVVSLRAPGCGGIVCAATDLPAIKAAAPDIVTVVPGIRPDDAPTHDQGRVATPAEAIRGGADILVIGRAVTASSDPSAAAEAVAREVAQALRHRHGSPLTGAILRDRLRDNRYAPVGRWVRPTGNITTSIIAVGA